MTSVIWLTDFFFLLFYNSLEFLKVLMGGFVSIFYFFYSHIILTKFKVFYITVMYLDTYVRVYMHLYLNIYVHNGSITCPHMRIYVDTCVNIFQPCEYRPTLRHMVLIYAHINIHI